jgi:hypothetical protein
VAGDIAVEADEEFTVTLSNSSGATISTATATGRIINDDFNAVTNQPPTALNLSASSFDENIPAGSTVATLDTTDPDVGNTFTYSLVSGSGDSDNDAFSIDGNRLLIQASPDFESKSSYSLRIRSTDQGGLSVERVVSFAVNNLNDGPATFAITGTRAVGQTLTATVATPDPDGYGTFSHTWQASAEGSTWSTIGTGAELTIAPAQEGQLLRLLTAYTDGGGFSESVTTAAGNVLFVNDGQATFSITGTRAVGQTLTAAVATADPDGNGSSGFSHTWQASADGTSWNTIGTGVELTIAPAQEGQQLRLLTAYTDGQGFSESVTTAAGTVPFVNNPPTALALTNTITSLAENTSTTSRIKVADIVVTDDALGTNVITLAGADAASFEVVGTELFIKAGTALDFETKTSFAVTVSVSDPSLPGSTPVSAAFNLAVSDVNEPPTAVALTNTITSLAENTSTTSRIKVADIVVTDDALGTNVITLAGADAASFEVVGTELFIKAGTALDFETKTSFAVTVSVSDPSLPGSTPVSAAFNLAVSDVNEPPTAVALTNTITSLAENTSTTSRIKVADIVVTDDALGSNVITLAGADAASFEVIGSALFLKAGTALDFETKTSFAVTVSVSDPSLPGSTPVSAAFNLAVSDVSDPGPTNSTNLTTPNQQIITFAADPGSPLPTIASVSNLDLSGLPADIRLDQGLYAINYDDVPIGGSVTLTLFLPQGSNVNSYWKYGPPSQGAAEQWYDFRFDPLTETGATFQDLNGDGQNEVILRFRDGLRGDSDLTVNGRIIDPGAPAFDPSLLSPPTPDPPSPAITPPLPQPTPTPDAPKPSSKPQPIEPIPSKPTPIEPIPGEPSKRKPNIIRATADIDTLTGTPRRDIFVFSGVQPTSSPKNVGFDTIIDFQSRDRIRIRNFNQKVISNPGNKMINALQGTANELSFDAINKTLGKDFRGQAIGAFEVGGYSGTFLAVNGGRRKIEGGRPGFDRRDMLLFLEGYDLGQQGPIVLA